MKRIINKTVLTVILALSMVLALFSGLLFVRHSDVADAAATPITVTFTTDKDEVFPGDTFTLTMKIETTGLTGTSIYNSVSIFIGLLSDETTYDITNQSLFVYSNYSTTAATNNNGVATPWLFTDSSGIVDGSKAEEAQQKGMFKYSLTKRSGVQYRPLVSEALEMTLDVTVDGNAPKNTSYKFGAQIMAANLLTIDSASNKYTFDVASKVTVQDADVLVREASDNNNLTSLKVGQGDTLGDDDVVSLPADPTTPIAVEVKDPSLPLSVLPETEHSGAKVYLIPGDIEVDSGDIGKIDIPSNGEVKVVIEAENGAKKTYTLNVTVNGAALQSLTVVNNTTKTGLTKNGFDTANPFASATEEYTIYVPSDSTTVTITATVTATTGASNTMDLTKGGTGTWTVASTATSGAAFTIDVSEDKMKDGDTLAIACRNATEVTKTYTLTFDVVDVDTSIESITVVGTNNTFANSEVKATANSADYYYSVVGQTTAPTVTVTSTSAQATVSLTGSSATQTVSKALNASATPYTITVVAEAGNSESFTMIIRNQEVLKLASDATADFIYKTVEVTTNFTYQRVASYKQNSLTHGIDDVNFERIVIGKVREETVVNDFILNFDSTQRSRLRITTYDDELLYDCGAPGAGFSEDELGDADYGYFIGTGWKVELMAADKTTVEDTIYVSMLGDVNGDGAITGADMTIVVNYVKGTNITTLSDLEFFLAALISNSGYVNATDIGEVSEHGNRYKNIHDYYYDTF